MAPIRANQITGTTSDFKMGVIKVIIIQMSDKIRKGAQFINHRYDYRQNWMSRCDQLTKTMTRFDCSFVQ